jgi:hypothetical protein
MSLFRRFATGIAIVAGGSVPVSCSALFGLDGYRRAADSLCTKLESCDPGKYGDCKSFVSSGLDNASPSAREKWLGSLTATGALDTCPAARAALDAVPICHDSGSGCSQDSHCCGFTNSLAKCNAGAGTCCKGKGVACGSKSECCADDGGTDVDCVTDVKTKTKVCGGETCTAPNGTCKADSDCCSNNCDEKAGKCLSTCIDTGNGCGAASDCCTAHCSDNKCVCLADGAACVFATECCGKVCNKGLCETPKNCAGLQQGCSTQMCCDQYQCSGGLVKKCCEPNGTSCSQGSMNCCNGGCEGGKCCTIIGRTACKDSSDCCEGDCLSFKYSAGTIQSCCKPSVCASPCQANASPLTIDKCTPSGKVDVSACIKAVCGTEKNRSCCCQEWTDACVALMMNTPSCMGILCL